MTVTNITSDDGFRPALTAAGDKLVVIDFFSNSCGPCMMIAPVIEQLSEKYKDVVFLKANVEVCRGAASTMKVSSIPTFIFVKKMQPVDTVIGANAEAVEAAIVKHSMPGSGGSDGSMCHINSLIDKKGIECLNQDTKHSVDNIFAESDGYLESDCDEQLIISVAFNQPVKLHSITFAGPDDGRAPKNIKLFINRNSTLNFDDAESEPALQEFELSAEDVKEGIAKELKYVKFQNVTSLTIFIVDNQGDEETTVVKQLGFIGVPRDATDMSGFKRVSGEVGERHG